MKKNKLNKYFINNNLIFKLILNLINNLIINKLL